MKSYKPIPEIELQSVQELEECLTSVENYMDVARLQINCDKTEFITFGSKAQHKKTLVKSINVCEIDVKVTDFIRYLGAWLDKHLNFRKHIQNKCKAAMINLLRLKTIRNVIPKDTMHTLVRALVISHLDYANCILYGLPEKDLNQLQRLHNMAAKLMCNKAKYDSAAECLKDLHWLPIRQRIKYKILCIVHKCVNGKCLDYLRNLLIEKVQHRPNLRSNKHSKLLKEIRTRRKTFADRSFSVAGPVLWNQMTDELRTLESYDEFKKKLKTYLFKKAFV